MPWHIKKKGSKFCVVEGKSGSDGEEVKCHDSQDKAAAHMKALYRNAKDYNAIIAAFLTEEPEYAFTRFFFKEGQGTVDGRAIDPHSINFDRLPPLPIRLQLTQPESGGHAGATLCGVITKVARDGLVIVADGFFDLGSEAGREALRLSTPGPNGEHPILQTWSPDLGNVIADMEVNATDEDVRPEDEVLHVVSGTLLGITIAALPALDAAVFEIYDQRGGVLVPAPQRNGPEILAAKDRQEPADGGQGGNVIDVKVPMMSDASLISCGGSEHPPAAFFDQQTFSELQQWTTVTSDGQVFGHLADPTTCHVGFLDRCITIDVIDDWSGDGNFEFANDVGHVITAEGTKIGTGPIAVKGGHADKALGWQKALAHYDDPSTVVADVRYYKDDHGFSFSGALRPTATKEQVYALRASGVSLDARPIAGKLRLLGGCCVNTPGFPKVTIRASIDEDGEPEILTLLVAAAHNELITDDCLCHECDDNELSALTDRVFATLDSRISRAS